MVIHVNASIMPVCSIPALSCDNAVRMAMIPTTFQQQTTAKYCTCTQHCKHNHVLMHKYIHSCIYKYIFTYLYTYIQAKKETEIPSLIRYGPRRKIVEYPQLPAIRLVTHGEPEATDNWLILVVCMAIHTCPQPPRRRPPLPSTWWKNCKHINSHTHTLPIISNNLNI